MFRADIDFIIREKNKSVFTAATTAAGTGEGEISFHADIFTRNHMMSMTTDNRFLRFAGLLQTVTAEKSHTTAITNTAYSRGLAEKPLHEPDFPEIFEMRSDEYRGIHRY